MIEEDHKGEEALLVDHRPEGEEGSHPLVAVQGLRPGLDHGAGEDLLPLVVDLGMALVMG